MTNPRRQRWVDALVGRVLGQVPVRTPYEVRPVRTPVRDGTVLLADHYAPTGPGSRGTVLIRTPYGRGFPTSALNGRLLAARGYHVLVQSVRGTFGSGGRFEPMVQETADGHDTVAWLRTQDWFDGRLATLGGSYLGWTQWTILQDPPPELRTSVIYVAPHDFHAATYGTGAFTLGDFLGWSYQITRQEDSGGLRRVVDTIAATRRLRPAYAGLPLPEAAEIVLHGRAPWYREWATHTDGSDPWWQPYRAGAALSRVTTPVLLIGGWQDLFLEQTLRQYAALRDRGVEVALTVGPWTHLDVASRGAAQVGRESVAWLDQHLAGGPPARRRPVHAFRTGERRWHRLAAWPPASAPAVFRLHPTGTLTLAATAPDVPPAAAPPANGSPDAALPAHTPPVAALSTDGSPAAALPADSSADIAGADVPANVISALDVPSVATAQPDSPAAATARTDSPAAATTPTDSPAAAAPSDSPAATTVSPGTLAAAPPPARTAARVLADSSTAADHTAGMGDRESTESSNPRPGDTPAPVSGQSDGIPPAHSAQIDEPAIPDTPPASDKVDFWYDPADPTPTLGGRTLTGSMGVKDNRRLEARPDVRSFTTDPLPTAVDVIGSPVLDLAISADTTHADVFVRLCDVDEQGRSRNFSDLMHRLDPTVPPGDVHHLTLTLDPCFHRLRAGHRLRLLVTGGAFPRYARAVPDSGRLTPSHRTIHCAASRLTLPVAAGRPPTDLP